jgi:PhzF family phenazine biosynthesis protein
MKYQLFQVDAFSYRLFGGNPAAVCPLNYFPEDEIMQCVAAENNLAETAFFIHNEGSYDLRWFTPTTEVDLCGHATLATAHVLWNHLNYVKSNIRFNTRSGELSVSRIGDAQYLMDLPSDHPYKVVDEKMISIIEAGIGLKIIALYKGRDDFMAVVASEKDILNLTPNFNKIAILPSRGLIVTSKGNISDFVSRCFFPQSGVNEDPVTGSAHTLLTPYWSMELLKNNLSAIQLSSRKGKLKCIYKGDRTAIIGSAITYMSGQIYL